MAKGKSNWTFREVKKFLELRGFVLHHVRGSHHYFRGSIRGKLRMANVPFHGSKTIHPKTISSIIKQSGIPEEDWLE